MARQDVPYGGTICRLKERIAEIWDKLDQKLHSINGVEGDGAGNVEIVSGDAAITVSESTTGHYIEIGLDHGNLPSAAVSSVNGQTGAVRLDAADIPSEGNSNVQSDLAMNKETINALNEAIGLEETARQNADATLQTNINAVSASIPEMSMTPDPYKGVERDAQGRAFAADPAAGATDKTLVTANWVSQTGDNGPNNLVHKIGNETKSGLFLCPEVRPRSFYSTKHVVQTVDAAAGVYYQIYKTTLNTVTDRNALILWNNTRKGLPNQCKECGILSIGARPTSVQIANIAGTVPTNHFAITRKADGSNTEVAFWATGQIKVYDILFESIGYNNIDAWSVGDLSTVSDFTSYDEVKYL